MFPKECRQKSQKMAILLPRAVCELFHDPVNQNRNKIGLAEGLLACNSLFRFCYPSIGEYVVVRDDTTSALADFLEVL